MFSQRIIDNIPRIIDHDFLRSIAKEVQESLIAGLALGTDQATERAGVYLAEDPQVKIQRLGLTQKKDTLDAVLKELYKFQMQLGGARGSLPQSAALLATQDNPR